MGTEKFYNKLNIDKFDGTFKDRIKHMINEQILCEYRNVFLTSVAMHPIDFNRLLFDVFHKCNSESRPIKSVFIGHTYGNTMFYPSEKDCTKGEITFNFIDASAYRFELVQTYYAKTELQIEKEKAKEREKELKLREQKRIEREKLWEIRREMEEKERLERLKRATNIETDMTAVLCCAGDMTLSQIKGLFKKSNKNYPSDEVNKVLTRSIKRGYILQVGKNSRSHKIYSFNKKIK